MGARHGRRSLFVKLLFVAVLAGLCINGAVVQGVRSLFFTSSGGWREIAVRHGTRYIDSLIAALGTPPDGARITSLARELDVEIRVTGNDRTWETRADLPAGEAMTNATRGNMITGMSWGVVGKRTFVRRTKGDFRYEFFWARPHGWDLPWRSLAWLVFVLTTILGVAWAALRRMLHPLKALETGVARIAEGDFAHRVRFRGHDELALLADSFNRMAERIGGMMRSREQLLLDVSHELRSPLTRLRLGLELLPEGPARAELAEDVREMERMVEEILETQRLDAPDGGLRHEAVDVAALAREMGERYAERAPGLVVTAPRELSLLGDPTRLRSVLRNLVENALKYSAGATKPVELTVAEAQDTVVLTVRDHGPGIPVSERENVFKPFYRVDKSRTKETGGFGLGLSLCRKVIEAHGGSIAISGEDGVLVTVRLPRGFSAG